MQGFGYRNYERKISVSEVGREEMQEKLSKLELERFKMPSAEERFKELFAEKKLELEIIKDLKGLAITKKGFPDFMIYKEESKEIVGFVEVKRTDLSDGLREEQRMFRDFCKRRNIPYQVWSPCMAGKRWKKASERFRRAMLNG